MTHEDASRDAIVVSPPTEGRTDELLNDPPDLGLGGTLEGYQRGSRMRIVLLAAIVAAFAGMGVLWWWLGRERPVTPRYTVDPQHSTDPSARVLHWESEGTARLGMTREPPGVHEIVLPDRILRLAQGSEHAQVAVEIRSGRTVSVRTLTGNVHMETRSKALEPAP